MRRQPDSSAVSLLPDPAEDKRNGIVAAAITVFARLGFEKARIADIAADAHVGKGTVYEYFRSKEELLLAACRQTCLRNQIEIEGAVAGLTSAQAVLGMNPVKAMHTIMTAVVEVVLTRAQDDMRLYLDLTAVCREQPALLHQAQALWAKLYECWEGILDQLYTVGVAQGYFRPVPHPNLVSRVFNAAVDGLIWQLSWRTDLKPRELAVQIAENHIHLLLIDPGRQPELLK